MHYSKSLELRSYARRQQKTFEYLELTRFKLSFGFGRVMTVQERFTGAKLFMFSWSWLGMPVGQWEGPRGPEIGLLGAGMPQTSFAWLLMFDAATVFSSFQSMMCGRFLVRWSHLVGSILGLSTLFVNLICQP